MDVGTFFGAFLGFLGGISVDRIATWWQRRDRRRAYGNLIATELARNLALQAGDRIECYEVEEIARTL